MGKNFVLFIATIAMVVSLFAAHQAHIDDRGYMPLIFAFLAGALMVVIGGLITDGE